MIVDAQAHLWKAQIPRTGPGCRTAWRNFPSRSPIEKLVPMMDEADVDRVVIVPPSWEGDRNDYALEAVRRYPDALCGHGPHAGQGPEHRRSFCRTGRSSRACSASG